jgi:hypothetical protein
VITDAFNEKVMFISTLKEAWLCQPKGRQESSVMMVRKCSDDKQILFVCVLLSLLVKITNKGV